MIACVVLRDGNRTKMDYDFSHDVVDADGELRYAKLNPVRILESITANVRIMGVAREIWLGDWVLDCDTLRIHLHTDYTVRSLQRRLGFV